MSTVATERVEFWGGPRDGLALEVALAQPDGLQLPAHEAPEGFYRLTTYPAGRPRHSSRRRLWAWWTGCWTVPL